MKTNKKQQRPQKLRKNRRIQPRAKSIGLPFRATTSALKQLVPRIQLVCAHAGKHMRVAYTKVVSLHMEKRFLHRLKQGKTWFIKYGRPILTHAFSHILRLILLAFSKEHVRLLLSRARRSGVWVGATLQHQRPFRSALHRIRGLRLKVVVHFFNPRVVRLEEPSRFVAHSIMITLLFAVVAVTAFAVAASVRHVPEKFAQSTDEPIKSAAVSDDTLRRKEWLSEGSAQIEPQKSPVVVADRSLSAPIAVKPSSKANTDFYRPLYIFTQAEADSVRAYPLTSPPGIVVDVLGLEEPEERAEEMVGEDERVQKVKRLTTSGGIRYIIRLSHPVNRIESHVEGNVITVNPLR